MLTVGLTGPTGAGKSSLRALLCKYRCDIVDCDICAREIVVPGSAALIELARAFGGDIIAPDGSLIRPLLAARAFADADGRSKINAITHPHIRALTEKYIAAAHSAGRHAAVDAPLLFESGFDSMCDVTIAILAPREMRETRIMQRDSISSQAARLRMSAQHDDAYYSSRASFTLINDSTPEEFERRAKAVLDEIFSSYGTENDNII